MGSSGLPRLARRKSLYQLPKSLKLLRRMGTAIMRYTLNRYPLSNGQNSTEVTDETRRRTVITEKRNGLHRETSIEANL